MPMHQVRNGMDRPLPLVHETEAEPHRVHDTETSNPRGIGWVVGQMLLLGTVAVVAPRCRSPRPAPLAVAGGVMLLLYAAWTGLGGVRSLGRNLTPLPAPRDDGELATEGMFARVSHPLYASVMAMGFGWALFWGSRLALGPATALALYLHAKALHEERLLRARFSEYPDYSAHVPRYLPRMLRQS